LEKIEAIIDIPEVYKAFFEELESIKNIYESSRRSDRYSNRNIWY